jgi:osmotically-inducible protein OsmY
MDELRLELQFGAVVQASDGAAGRLREVLVYPRQRRVIGLVVRSGWLPPRDIDVPITQVLAATAREVRLRVDRSALALQPAFARSGAVAVVSRPGAEASKALAAIHSAAGDARALRITHIGALARSVGQVVPSSPPVVLRRRHPVWASDGRAGTLVRLRTDPAGRIQHLVVRLGRLGRQVVLVPVDWVDTLDTQRLRVTHTRAAFERLPRCRPDAALAAEVERALWSDEVVRALDYADMEVTVGGGVVALHGYAATPVSKIRAERAVRQVPGVLAVDNQLVTDDEVAGAVAQALACEVRTAGLPIAVEVRHGVVTLRGEALSAEERAASAACAARVALVRGVVNQVRAPGVDLAAEDQRVLLPEIGQEVYATDMQLGRVTRVIVSRCQGRVTAVVVCGRFPEGVASSAFPDQLPKQERQAVIPIRAVRDVTPGGVLLALGGMAAAHYPDLDLAQVAVPASDWAPPYPYRRDDVLFEREDRAGALSKRTATVPVGVTQPMPFTDWRRLRHGMRARFRDGVGGTIDHLWLDPCTGYTGDVAIRVDVPAAEVVVPLDRVQPLDTEEVLVDMDAVPSTMS